MVMPLWSKMVANQTFFNPLSLFIQKTEGRKKESKNDD